MGGVDQFDGYLNKFHLCIGGLVLDPANKLCTNNASSLILMLLLPLSLKRAFQIDICSWHGLPICKTIYVRFFIKKQYLKVIILRHLVMFNGVNSVTYWIKCALLC